jgi:hypothetical protein
MATDVSCIKVNKRVDVPPFNQMWCVATLQRGKYTPILLEFVMNEVTLVSNDGCGLPIRIPVTEGTTLEKFLEVHFDGDPNEFTIRVRANGTTVECHRDYVLCDGDRVSLAPNKIEGAV